MRTKQSYEAAAKPSWKEAQRTKPLHLLQDLTSNQPQPPRHPPPHHLPPLPHLRPHHHARLPPAEAAPGGDLAHREGVGLGRRRRGTHHGTYPHPRHLPLTSNETSWSGGALPLGTHAYWEGRGEGEVQVQVTEGVLGRRLDRRHDRGASRRRRDGPAGE
jgi:hypothetical protein